MSISFTFLTFKTSDSSNIIVAKIQKILFLSPSLKTSSIRSHTGSRNFAFVGLGASKEVGGAWSYLDVYLRSCFDLLGGLKFQFFLCNMSQWNSTGGFILKGSNSCKTPSAVCSLPPDNKSRMTHACTHHMLIPIFSHDLTPCQRSGYF